MTASSEPVGSVGEEAAKLLAAAQEWARQRVPVEPHEAGAECQLCPLCQAIALVRQLRPETIDHLLAAAGSLTAALRSAVAPAAPPAGPGGVQRIDVREG